MRSIFLDSVMPETFIPVPTGGSKFARPVRYAALFAMPSLVDDKDEPAMGFAQSRFGLFRRSSAAEYESQIACAFGRRLNLLSNMSCNHDVFDVFDPVCFVDASDFSQDAALWNRDHHDSGGE